MCTKSPESTAIDEYWPASSSLSMNCVVQLPLVADAQMEKYAADLETYMEDSGLGKMKLDWLNGDWVNFFTTNPQDAGGLALAMAVVGFLAKCLGNKEDDKDLISHIFW